MQNNQSAKAMALKPYQYFLSHIIPLFIFVLIISSCSTEDRLKLDVYETSAKGSQLKKLDNIHETLGDGVSTTIELFADTKYQTITGIGGSFTESTAYLLNKLSKKNRDKILEAYFGESGARYSLTRTHMNSCDFSLSQYSYAPVEEDLLLENFTIKDDEDDIIPLIKDAMRFSKDGFKIISSPWTAPPWMKDNKEWVGGKLLPKYYDTWALFFSKYIDAYKAQGIEIWGVTVENEPHGNGNNWESMHYSPAEMTQFVQHHLGPKLEADGHGGVHIFGYDQNRAGIKEWVDVMFANEASSKYYAGTAIHWYESTYEVFPEALQYAHEKAPDKYLIETEGCVDSEVPKWRDDAWYWSKEATDWGWDWAPEKDKYLHPKYSPVNRYARDIIGCLNNWVDGWIDWNMVLDTRGGPNWFENWCVAPVIVDPEKDEIYYTPIYYVMSHFSRYIRPGAKIIDCQNNNKELAIVAAENPDGTIAVVVFNEGQNMHQYKLTFNHKFRELSIGPQAIQTIVIPSKNK